MDALYAGPLFSVADRVAVVTGGGSGLGLMQAVALASNGATVFITGRRRGKLEAAVTHYSQLDAVKSAGGSLVALQMDVDDQDSILKGVATIRESHDAISVLVNNAGVINGKTWDTSDLDVDALSRKWLGIGADAWEKTFRTNVTSAFNVSAAMLPLLAAGVAKFGPESSSIINIGSISGVMRNTQLGQVRSRGSRRALILSFCYNTSKSALQQLTRMLATELLRPSLRIRVNEVQPGYFPSEIGGGTSDERGVTSLDEQQIRAWDIPFGRVGTPSEMAQVTLLLATNRYMTGSAIVLDGGWLSTHA